MDKHTTNMFIAQVLCALIYLAGSAVSALALISHMTEFNLFVNPLVVFKWGVGAAILGVVFAALNVLYYMKRHS